MRDYCSISLARDHWSDCQCIKATRKDFTWYRMFNYPPLSVRLLTRPVDPITLCDARVKPGHVYYQKQRWRGSWWIGCPLTWFMPISVYTTPPISYWCPPRTVVTKNQQQAANAPYSSTLVGGWAGWLLTWTKMWSGLPSLQQTSFLKTCEGLSTREILVERWTTGAPFQWYTILVWLRVKLMWLVIEFNYSSRQWSRLLSLFTRKTRRDSAFALWSTHSRKTARCDQVEPMDVMPVTSSKWLSRNGPIV